MNDEYQSQYFWQETDPILESGNLLMDLLGYEKQPEGWVPKKQDNGKE